MLTSNKIKDLAIARVSHLGRIDKQRLNLIWDSAKHDPSYKYYQIKDNRLFIDFNEPFQDFETRLEGGKAHLLGILSKYRIPDTEFILYDGDSLNTDEPIFVPGCAQGRNQLIVPDYMFKFNQESNLQDHHEAMQSIFCAAKASGLEFESWNKRQEKIFYRGSLNNVYRGQYQKIDGIGICDLKHVTGFHAPRGVPNYKPGESPNACTREEKSNYKFLLHLNGGEDTAISGAFRYSLACGSTVFYATRNPYQEWWQHSLICSSKNYIEVKDPQDLLNAVDHFRKNPRDAHEIAINGYEFANEYFGSEMCEQYYANFLIEYSQRTNWEVSLRPNSKPVKFYKKRAGESIVMMEP